MGVFLPGHESGTTYHRLFVTALRRLLKTHWFQSALTSRATKPQMRPDSYQKLALRHIKHLF